MAPIPESILHSSLCTILLQASPRHRTSLTTHRRAFIRIARIILDRNAHNCAYLSPFCIRT